VVQPTIAPFTGDLEELLPFFHMSTGIDGADGVRQLIAMERTRGTRYYTATLDGRVVGMIGLWFDPSGEVSALEPPQVIDIAVLPDARRQGLARALMDTAVEAVRAAGYRHLWLYTDGNSAPLLAFYRRLRFRIISAVPDWFGEGTVKAILRREL